MPHPYPFRPDDVRPYRIESWSEGGRHHVLVMGADAPFSGHDLGAWMLAVDERTGECEFRYGSFQHHGPFTAPGPAVARALRSTVKTLSPGYRSDYSLFGIPPFDREPVLVDVLSQAIIRGTPLKVPYPTTRRPPPFLRERGPARYLLSGMLEFNFTTLGYQDPRHECDRPSLTGYVDVPTMAGTPRGIVDPLDRARPSARTQHDWHANAEQGVALLGEIKRRLAEAMAPVAALLRAQHHDFMGRLHVSSDTRAFYAAPGVAGERRRQAGELYPIFAPLFAKDPELARLVDGGRPYEERLARFLAEAIPFGEGMPAPSVATLRRFRSLPPNIVFPELLQLLANAAKLPPDWLPDSAKEWDDFRDVMEEVNHFCGNTGLDLADLLRQYPGKWKDFKAEHGRNPGGPNLTPLSQRLNDAEDACKQMDETLITPVILAACEEAGIDPDEVKDGITKRLAAQALYGGRSVGGVIKASTAWHEGMTAFQARLPLGEVAQSWPPFLKEPFVTRVEAVGDRPERRGEHVTVRIVPLTDQAQITAEGGRGPDLAGIPGLDHCVGGYGKQCFIGESHILSVRQDLPGGGHERLSTVELRTDHNGMPRLIQHRGLRNQEPPPAAQAAVADLMSLLGRDASPINPEAYSVRSEHELKASYDWRDPAKLGQAFEAWRPFLPRNVAAAGLDGLREKAAGILDARPALAP